MGPWEDWLDIMWSDLRKSSGVDVDIQGGALKAEITAPKFASHLGGPDIGYGIVKVNRDIGGGGEVGFIKKHMEIELPAGTGYRSGKHALDPLD